MLKGVKVWTSRTKKYGEAGDRFEAFGEVYEIVVVVKKPLAFVAKNWSEEGCSSRDDFVEVWQEIHPRKGFVPDWEVWVHIFKKLGSGARFSIVRDIKNRPYIMSGENLILSAINRGDEQLGMISVSNKRSIINEYLNLEELKNLRDVADGIIQRIEDSADYGSKTQ